jgi:hypothetical protein
MQKQRYRLFRRKNGTYYSFENDTGRQISLFTKDRGEATGLLAAKNQATAQPILNVAMAKVYLSAKSPELLTRTWGELIEVMMKGYTGATAVPFRSLLLFLQSGPGEVTASVALT